MLLFVAAAAVLPFQFHVDAAEFANTVYHTACLNGRMVCSREIYQRFWKERYRETTEDEARFHEFGGILDQLETAAGPSRPTPFLPNDFINSPGQKVCERVVAAGLASKSAAEFRRRARSLIPVEKADKLAAILDSVERRLHPWWISSGQPAVQMELPGIEQRIRASGAAELATAVELLLCERTHQPLNDPYTDLYIPRLGKAILPLLRTALARHATLWEGFTRPYLEAGRAALGEEADAPAFRFSCVALLADEEVRNAFLQILPLRYFVTSDQARLQFARLDRLLMMRYEQLQLGGPDAGAVQELAAKHRGFIAILQKEERMDFLMAGRDNTALSELAKMWAESKGRVRPGLLFSIY